MLNKVFKMLSTFLASGRKQELRIEKADNILEKSE